jgi:hypothetical protein
MDAGSNWIEGSRDAVGEALAARIDESVVDAARADGVYRSARQEILYLRRMNPTEERKWTRSARSGSWVRSAGTDGEGNRVVMAVDGVRTDGGASPFEALYGPETYSRTSGWWLARCWRSTELSLGAVTALQQWRLATAASLTRSLLENTAVWMHEYLRLSAAWSALKQSHVAEIAAGPEYSAFVESLKAVEHGTRVQDAAEPAKDPTAEDMVTGFKATNILTHLDHLQRAAPCWDVRDWYDWLSDAAHPAYGGNTLYLTQYAAHRSGAYAFKFLGSSPLSAEVDDSGARSARPVPTLMAEALTALVPAQNSLRDETLRLVDDVMLTFDVTRATTRQTWRPLATSRGSRDCECGRGKWKDCRHLWGDTYSVPESRLILSVDESFAEANYGRWRKPLLGNS